MSVIPSSGILVVDTPVGLTSFDVVARVRRLMRIRRVGHCGTLDPFAQGVLPILVGRATGLARYMEVYDKSYRVTVRFGSYTDTQDRTGRPYGERLLSDGDVTAMQRDQFSLIRQAVAALEGEQMQTPPMYSAVKIDGKPLYQYARQGLEVKRAARRIHVYRAELISIHWEQSQLEAVVDIDCSKGTYIRTLCQDLGEKTGLGAHAAALIRTACGPFDLTTAITWEGLMAVSDQGDDPWQVLHDQQFLLPLERALPHFPTIRYQDADVLRFIQGQSLPIDASTLSAHTQPGLRMALFGARGFVGVGVVQKAGNGTMMLHAERVLVDREDC